ncbi:PilZ domain-containing protein [Haliea sp. E17]|uniref:PilZ domain-containing protein n=1 Tax=Haliea sp. E17 TaxID=3401576 RepID=UPI003AAAD584
MDLERRHIRLPAKYRVYIEADAAAGEDNSIEVCRALDVSLSGLQLELTRELALNAYIHVGVEASGAAPLILVAVVRWCRPADADRPDTWRAGLELQPDAADSDYSDWRRLLAQFDD